MLKLPIYPHEDKELAEEPRLDSSEIEKLAKIYATSLIERGVGAVRGSRAYEKAKKSPLSYGRSLEVNGDKALSVLRDKHEFVQMLQVLGYTVPQEFLLKNGEVLDHDSLEQFLRIIESKRVLLKPRYGSQGKDIVRTSTFRLAERIKGFVNEEGNKGLWLDRSYLAQEELPVITDYRYMGYKTEDNKFYRVAYEKKTPSVESDGRRLIWQLLYRQEFRSLVLPFLNYFFREKGELTDFAIRNTHQIFDKIPKGKSIPMIQSGNVHQGAIPAMIDRAELTNLDRFMAQFLDDIEKEIGKKLSYFCFDIGSMEEMALEGEYDFDRIKKSLCFFEFQTIAGISSYKDLIKELGIDPKIYLGFQRACVRDAIARSISE